jgi:hypothetical protein
VQPSNWVKDRVVEMFEWNFSSTAELVIGLALLVLIVAAIV